MERLIHSYCWVGANWFRVLVSALYFSLVMITSFWMIDFGFDYSEVPWISALIFGFLFGGVMISFNRSYSSYDQKKVEHVHEDRIKKSKRFNIILILILILGLILSLQNRDLLYFTSAVILFALGSIIIRRIFKPSWLVFWLYFFGYWIPLGWLLISIFPPEIQEMIGNIKIWRSIATLFIGLYLHFLMANWLRTKSA